MIGFEKCSLTKEELKELEAEEISLPIFVVDDTTPLHEVEQLCNTLSKSNVLGFDTETRPVFQKGTKPNKVALLQLGNEELAVLFRLNKLKDTPHLSIMNQLLENSNVLKVGVSMADDVKELCRDSGLVTLNVLDLRNLAVAAQLEVQSLSKIYAILYGKRLSKSQRVSNWENDILTDAQIAYAALDAVAGYRIYQQLKEYEKEGMRIVDFRTAPKSKKKQEKPKKKATKSPYKKANKNVGPKATSKK